MHQCNWPRMLSRTFFFRDCLAPLSSEFLHFDAYPKHFVLLAYFFLRSYLLFTQAYEMYIKNSTWNVYNSRCCFFFFFAIIICKEQTKRFFSNINEMNRLLFIHDNIHAHIHCHLFFIMCFYLINSFFIIFMFLQESLRLERS